MPHPLKTKEHLMPFIKKTVLNARVILFMAVFTGCLFSIPFAAADFPSRVHIPDTGQTECFNNTGKIPFPESGRSFYGQDAHYQTRPMAYQDNGDGTVTDLVTGLMWSKAVNPEKISLNQARRVAARMTLGGYTDWRVPNIKELYSLMNFSGNTGTPGKGTPTNVIPYINTDYFNFRFGSPSDGERYIDAQWLSSTHYVSTTMNGAQTLFGVNFADGRIKGYGYARQDGRGRSKTFFVRYVRGKPYGHNDFMDNNDGTVTDKATGLIWMKADSGKGMNWKQALAYAESMTFAGYSDWRLPDAKELQYIVDYARSPDTTSSPVTDPVFDTTAITNESGQKDYPYFWTSTTHEEGPRPGNMGVYISFGRAMGQMKGQNMDVHGAGAQRSDPKSGQGNISKGPQGDWIRINNFVRLVRGGQVTRKSSPGKADKSRYPYILNIENPSALTTASDSTGKNRPSDPSAMDQHQAFDTRQRPGGSGSERFIRRFDRNKDNRVSSSEFFGPSDHFNAFDKNGDGYITADEAPTGPPPGNRMGPPPRKK